MSPSVFLVIDDDLDSLRDVEQQLVRRYGQDYRVETAGDAAHALRTLDALAESADELVLILVSQSLADASGDGVLDRARRRHPHAKRALMVGPFAFADPPTAQAILDAIGLGHIDYYVPRPAGAPDEVFQSTIATFVLEWA